MTDYINSLYTFELESGRLDFEGDPDYRKALARFSQYYDALYQTGDHKQCETLWGCCFDLLDLSARAAFRRGMCLGMGLMCWGLSGL